MKTKISFLFLNIFICTLNYSHSTLASNPDTVTATSPKLSSGHSLFVGTGFGNDLLYDGSALSVNQPFVSADISYIFRNTLWASVTAYNLTQQDFLLPMADFSAGIKHTFNDYLDASAALSTYRIAPELKTELHENFSFFRIRGGLDWYWLYTSVTAGTILGKDKGWYLYLRNSRYFSTPDFGKARSYFSFDPNINIAFGKTSYYQPDMYTKSLPVRPPIYNPPVDDTNIDYTTDVRWQLMKVEFSFPVAFYYNRFAIEAEPVYLVTSFKPDTHSGNGFFLFINAYFKIF